MIKRVVLLVITILLSFPTQALAAGPVDGVIEGQLVNGTSGGSSVGNQTVILKSYTNDRESANATARTGTDGKFVFNGLSTAIGNSYNVIIKYMDADYASGIFSLADNETKKSTKITVYDSTDSDANISISAAHTIVYQTDNNLEVVEYLVYTNSSDRSYIGSGDITMTGGRKTLVLPLPAEATGLQLGGDLSSEYVIPDANGLADTMAVMPGDTLVAYSYVVGHNFGSYKLSQKYEYPISTYSFLIQGETTKATSNQLSAGQVVDFQGLKFVSLSGRNITRGATLVVQLSGLSADAGSSPTGSSTVLLVVLGVIVVLGGSGGIVYMMKRRNTQTVHLDGNPEQLKQQLLLDIASMDDDFESGKLDKETYTKLRAEMKSQLVGLMQDSEAESGRG